MPNSLSSLAYKHIRKKILSGTLACGSKLSETTLAKEIGISRTPIREAIAQLEQELILDQIPKYGTFVRVLEQDEVEELYDFRIQIEGFATELAAARFTGKDCEALLKISKEMMAILRNRKEAWVNGTDPDSAGSERWRYLDASFHIHVIKMCGNRWVSKVAEQCRLFVQIFSYWQEIPDQNYLAIGVRTWREHRRLIRLLSHGRATAAREAVVEHILNGKKKVLAYYDWCKRNMDMSNTELSESMLQHLQNIERYRSIRVRPEKTK